MKRVLDVTAVTAALVVVSPLLLAIAVAVRASSPGPVLHRSRRVGRNGDLFTLLKFRSMRITPDGGPAITAGGDARITRVGRVLRATKLDELPQLWNVVRGEMSLVGPRPEDPRYVAFYTAEQRRLLAWRPGLTSPASVMFRDEESILAREIASGTSLDEAYHAVLDTKLAMELEYFPQATMAGDLLWIWRTVSAIVRRPDARRP